MSNDSYSGNDLNTPQNAVAGTLFTNTRPFQLQYMTNAHEINTIDNLSVALSLDYIQIACSITVFTRFTGNGFENPGTSAHYFKIVGC